MKKILAALLVGALAGALAAHAKLPPPTEEQKAAAKAKAEKDAADAAKANADLAKAQDRAVANYKKHQGAAQKK
ncbi:MAG: hypothetical protein JO035_11985 [Betaproteobacteria bacterium]|nr:hypothetical protein [Betaproteobacteria bacterium]